MTPIAHPLTQLFAGLVVALALVACGGDEASPPPPTEGSATIGPAGGTVTSPDGVKLALPPEALETDTTFRIARDGSGAPPLPAGIDLASAVYAITPHGGAFGASASVELPVSAALAAGRPTFLMKANPGGRWAVIGSGATGAATLRAGIDSLSYLAVGACQDNLPAGSPLAQACPSSHRLSLELLINGTTPVPISQDTTYGAPIPVLLVTTPETLTFRMTWTRPAGTNRVDALDTGTSLSANSLVRNAGFTFSPTAPRFQDVNENSFSRIFTVDVDPARVSGASGPTGVVRRIWAQAAYAFTGPGNVGSANWEFTAWVPIQVRSLAAVSFPVIAAQPVDTGVTEGQSASFSVTASVTPAGTLSYQWSSRASASGVFAAIPGVTTASHGIASAALADHGTQYQVQVCAGPTRCVLSSVATLSVSALASAPVFTMPPVDQGVVAGQTASLNAVASGSPLPQIRWQSAPAGSSNFSDITGVPACAPTNPTTGTANVVASCTVGPLTLGDSGQRYRAVATSTSAPGGVTSSFATVTVNATSVAPAITQHPAPQTTTVGGSAGFSVTANGTAPLAYVWQQGGNNLPSVSGGFNAGGCSGTVTYSNGGSTITLSGLSAGCNGVQVGVTVSNGVNPNAVSNNATLTVTPVTAAWVTQNSGANNVLHSAATLDGNTVWAVGAGGWITRTTSGGANWIAQQIPNVSILYSVSAASSSVLWAVGADSILRSSDGGVTWVAQSGAASEYLYAVSAVDSVNAWAVGFNGVILRNSGTGWVTQVAATGPFETLSSVSHVDGNTAWATGPRRIWKTVDGGANWVQQTPGVTNYGGSVVASSNTSTAWVTAQGGVLKTVDGGATWTLETLPGSATPNALVRSGNTLWAFTQGQAAQVYRSTGGGVTGSWTAETPITPNHVHMYGFTAFAPNLIWAVGDGGLIVKH